MELHHVARVDQQWLYVDRVSPQLEYWLEPWRSLSGARRRGNLLDAIERDCQVRLEVLPRDGAIAGADKSNDDKCCVTHLLTVMQESQAFRELFG